MIKKLIKVYLPEEYQRVEYLESTGGQVINTGFTAITAPYMSLTFSVVDIVYYWNGANGSFNMGGDSTNFRINAVVFKTPVDHEKHTIDYYFDGTYRHSTLDNGQIAKNLANTPSLPFKLFLLGGAENNVAKIKVYVYKAFDANKTPLAYYIPCYRKSDNVAGMYDLVSGQFFTNAGTGSFIVGDDVENEPIPMIKEITSIKKYIPNVGLVNMRKVIKAGDKQVFSNSNLFELRKFLKYNDTPFGNVIKLEDSLHWELGFIVNELRFEGDPIGSIHLGNYSHLYSEPVALNKGDQLILNCSVGSATKKGALYSNATANETSFIRFVQDNEIILESGLYFRACYDIREPHELLLVKKYGSGILGICDIYHYDAFIYSDVILKEGHTYKISFDAKCNVNPNRTFWLHYADDIYQTDTSQLWEWHISGTGDWEHVEFNYTANRDMGIRFYAPFSTTETIQYYKDIIITQIN